MTDQNTLSVTDDRTGLSLRVAAVRLGPTIEETWPRFWD